MKCQKVCLALLRKIIKTWGLGGDDAESTENCTGRAFCQTGSIQTIQAVRSILLKRYFREKLVRTRCEWNCGVLLVTERTCLKSYNSVTECPATWPKIPICLTLTHSHYTHSLRFFLFVLFFNSFISTLSPILGYQNMYGSATNSLIDMTWGVVFQRARSLLFYF